MEKNPEDVEFVQVGTVSLDPNFQEEDSEELRQLKKKLTAGRPTKTLYEQLEEQREWKRLEKQQEEEDRFRPAYFDEDDAIFVNQLKEKEELLFQYSKQKEREDIEAFEEARAKKLLAKKVNLTENYKNLDDNDPKNESPSHSNSKKRKASDIDTQPSSSMINQQQPILIIKKKGDKKDKIKPKQTDNKKIKTESSKKDCTKSSTSSLTLENEKKKKDECKRSMEGLLGAYNDSDDDDEDDDI